MFQLPLVEIRDRFTISEQALVSWKNAETMFKMRRKTRDTIPPLEGQMSQKEGGGIRRSYGDPLIDSLPDRFFNKEGELDFSIVKGDEAAMVMNKQLQQLGLAPMPMYRR